MFKKIKAVSSTPETHVTDNSFIPASTLIPKWFKSIPPERNLNPFAMGRDRSTVKKCTPFTDALTTGYLLTLQQDVLFSNVDGKKYVAWGLRRPFELVETDELRRTSGIPVPEGYDETVWRFGGFPRIITPPGYSTLVTHPFNRYDLPFLTLSGITDSDKSHRITIVAVLLKKNFEGVLEKGTPLAQVFPFQRTNWQSEKCPPFSFEEQEKENYSVLSIANRSYHQFWSKKVYR
jgi:hypothetical protein